MSGQSSILELLKQAGALMIVLLVSSSIQAQYSSTAIQQLDAFFKASSNEPEEVLSYFTDEASIITITYDDEGLSEINPLSKSEYLQELNNLHEGYWVNQEPVVMIARSYGALATYFFSVYTQLADSSGDTMLIRSIQTAHMVFDKQWKISHLSIQNENTAMPIPDDLWPDELTYNLSRSRPDLVGFKPYDPTRFYTPAEVDMVPEYPGDEEAFDRMLKAFDITQDGQSKRDPFSIIITEDGGAHLANTEHLSDKQFKKVESFVNQMSPWYPAIKDAASVKCELIFYLP